MSRRVQLTLALVIAATTVGTTTCAWADRRDPQNRWYRIPIPTTDLIMEFPLDGFEVETEDRSRPWYYLVNRTTGVNVSFNFERIEDCNSSETFRDYFAAARLGMGRDPNKKNWEMSQVGDIFISEYMQGPIEGLDLRQQHMNAHYVAQGIWADIHLSKVQYQGMDKELFLRFLRSIKVNGIEIGLTAGESEFRSYAIAGRGVLLLEVPDSWKEEITRHSAGHPLTIELRPDEGDESVVMITPLWSRKRQKRFNSPTKIRSLVERDWRELASSAVEKELTLEELGGEGVYGYYFRATDRNPAPGEFEYLLRAGVGVGELLLIVTILSHDRDSAEIVTALAMLRAARHQMP